MLKLQERRDLADKLLAWLKANKLERWPSNHDVLTKFSGEASEPLYDVWKAHELLRNVGRIGLVCPNGRKGGYIISCTPISKPVEQQFDVSKLKIELLKGILKDLRARFTNEWNDALEEIE